MYISKNLVWNITIWNSFKLIFISIQSKTFTITFQTIRSVKEVSNYFFQAMKYFSSVFSHRFYINFQVSQIGLVLLCKDFNPEKYGTLCDMFCRQYKKSGNAAVMLEAYLSVVTRGMCNNDDNGKFSVNDYSKEQAFATCCLRGEICFI